MFHFKKKPSWGWLQIEVGQVRYIALLNEISLYIKLGLYQLSDQKNEFGFMDVILLLGGHRHVSVTHVALFMVVGTRIQI